MSRQDEGRPLEESHDLEERLRSVLARQTPPPSAALLERIAAIPIANPRSLPKSTAATGRWLDGLLEPFRLAWAAGLASVLVAAVAGFLVGSDVEASYDTASDLSDLVYGPGEAPEDWP